MAVCCNHGIILKSFQIPRNLLCTVNRRGCLHAHTCTKRHNYRTNMSMHMYSQTHSFARSFPCAGCWLMMSVHVHDCLFELLIWSWYCLVFGLNIEKKRLIMYSFIMKTCFLSMADIFLQNPSDCKIHCYNQDFSSLSVCHTTCGCTRLPGLLLDMFLLLLLSLWTDLLRTWLPTTYSLCTTPPAFVNSVTTLISLPPHTWSSAFKWWKLSEGPSKKRKKQSGVLWIVKEVVGKLSEGFQSSETKWLLQTWRFN